MCRYFRKETDVQNRQEGLQVDKKYGGTRLISEKMEALYELKERVETATSSYSAGVDFLQYIYQVLVTENHYKIQSKNFPSQIFFNKINHGYKAAILKKIFFDCFLLIWLWLFIAIMKRWAEQCALQLYCTSLIFVAGFISEDVKIVIVF